MADHIAGTVYLLHFVRRTRNGKLVTARYKHAGHYLGWASEGQLEARLQQHRDGNGARLIRVIQANGLTFVLARTWDHADRYKERALKKTGGASRYCPACGVTPRN